jgi:hypothetical protein
LTECSGSKQHAKAYCFELKKVHGYTFIVGFAKHYSWRNNAGTKLNVQAGTNVTAHQNKKYLGFF